MAAAMHVKVLAERTGPSAPPRDRYCRPEAIAGVPLCAGVGLRRIVSNLTGPDHVGSLSSWRFARWSITSAS